MSLGRITRFALAATIATIGLAGAQLAPASAATTQAEKPLAVRTVLYNANAAGVWKDNVTAAVAIWNASEKNVKLAAGSPATMTIDAIDGWPYAEPSGLGRGRIHLGEQAVRDGFDRTRITAHEIGHILGLPDNRTGLCSDLMSGHSAPTSCLNAHPSPKEAATVDRNFANGFAAAATKVTRYDECFTERACV
ncbi:MAG: peptidase [Actinomycetia bacterium]|jgi:snapalysin|nr:peptidase [Actinomycetes bacterium]MDQ1657178.1 snapalysin [Cryptosporangiaceae bacterium]